MGVLLTVRVEQGDCRELVPARTGIVDAIVTDPPYHLQAVKRWGDETKIAANPNLKGNGMHRFAKGFMGAAWDGGDLAFDPATWERLATALRPGGFLLAFGGTRTYHRMACAIEDAGFVIQDCIMWLYGSGFPKRRDMLKPAYEPIVMAYKPGGARTLQVDECRVGFVDGADQAAAFPGGRLTSLGSGSLAGPAQAQDAGRSDFKTERSTLGRWPANICHDGSDEVIVAFPDSKSCNSPSSANCKGTILGGSRTQGAIYPGENGSAARFFFSAKAGAEDRWGSRHPTVKPVELMKWLVALVTPPDGLVLDPFAGSGTTGIAALATGRNAILIEREDAYVADIRERLAHYQGEGRHSLASRARNSAETDAGPLFRS